MAGLRGEKALRRSGEGRRKRGRDGHTAGVMRSGPRQRQKGTDEEKGMGQLVLFETSPFSQQCTRCQLEFSRCTVIYSFSYEPALPLVRSILVAFHLVSEPCLCTQAKVSATSCLGICQWRGKLFFFSCCVVAVSYDSSCRCFPSSSCVLNRFHYQPTPAYEFPFLLIDH